MEIPGSTLTTPGSSRQRAITSSRQRIAALRSRKPAALGLIGLDEEILQAKRLELFAESPAARPTPSERHCNDGHNADDDTAGRPGRYAPCAGQDYQRRYESARQASSPHLFSHRAQLLDALHTTIAQVNNPVGIARRLHIVSYHQQRHTALPDQPLQQSQDLTAGSRIKISRRLISQ
ncbi:MAG: hypothetical protein KatS3mg057_0835 [Herpetosiphonaceae bacterium]|nr:MAG: hypothetical protein KatS3mg057_0835 [Herpetosiphonaceae bacterium]